MKQRQFWMTTTPTNPLLCHADGGEGGGTGGGGGGEPPAFDFSAWAATQSKEAREHFEKSGYTDFSHIVDSEMAGQRHFGAPASEMARMPQGDFAEHKEAFMAVMDKLGRPAEPDGYGDEPKLDGFEFKDGEWAKVKDMFHGIGVPTWMSSQILEGVAGLVKDAQPAEPSEEDVKADLEAKHQAFVDAKTAELGAEKAAQMIADANGFIKANAPDELKAFLEESGLGNHPAMIEFGAKLAADYKGSGLGAQSERQPDGARTKAQIQAEIERLENDKEFTRKRVNASAEGHKAAVDKYTALHKELSEAS